MPSMKQILTKKYDGAPGTQLDKALKLLKDYSGTNSTSFSARAARAFRAPAPFADLIASELDACNRGEIYRIIPAEDEIVSVEQLLKTVIGANIYSTLHDDSKLKMIVDVILEKNNLNSVNIFGCVPSVHNSRLLTANAE